MVEMIGVSHKTAPGCVAVAGSRTWQPGYPKLFPFGRSGRNHYFGM